MPVLQQTLHKRNLLLAFDAFGTLFTPRKPIAVLYGEVARRHGLSGFSDDDLKTSFYTGTWMLGSGACSWVVDVLLQRSRMSRNNTQIMARRSGWKHRLGGRMSVAVLDTFP